MVTLRPSRVLVFMHFDRIFRHCLQMFFKPEDPGYSEAPSWAETLAGERVILIGTPSPELLLESLGIDPHGKNVQLVKHNVPFNTES